MVKIDFGLSKSILTPPNVYPNMLLDYVFGLDGIKLIKSEWIEANFKIDRTKGWKKERKKENLCADITLVEVVVGSFWQL